MKIPLWPIWAAILVAIAIVALSTSNPEFSDSGVIYPSPLVNEAGEYNTREQVCEAIATTLFSDLELGAPNTSINSGRDHPGEFFSIFTATEDMTIGRFKESVDKYIHHSPDVERSSSWIREGEIFYTEVIAGRHRCNIGYAPHYNIVSSYYVIL